MVVKPILASVYTKWYSMFRIDAAYATNFTDGQRTQFYKESTPLLLGHHLGVAPDVSTDGVHIFYMKNTSIFSKFDGSQNVTFPNASFERYNGNKPDPNSSHIRSLVATYGCLAVVKISDEESDMYAFSDPTIALNVHIKQVLNDILEVKDFKGNLKEDENGVITYHYGKCGVRYTITAYYLTDIEDHPECAEVLNSYLGELSKDDVTILPRKEGVKSDNFIASVTELQDRKFITELGDDEHCTEMYDSLLEMLLAAEESNSNFTVEFPESKEIVDEAGDEYLESGPVAILKFNGQPVVTHICHCPNLYPEQK